MITITMGKSLWNDIILSVYDVNSKREIYINFIRLESTWFLSDYLGFSFWRAENPAKAH